MYRYPMLTIDIDTAGGIPNGGVELRVNGTLVPLVTELRIDVSISTITHPTIEVHFPPAGLSTKIDDIVDEWVHTLSAHPLIRVLRP